MDSSTLNPNQEPHVRRLNRQLRVVFLWSNIYQIGGVGKFLANCLEGLPRFGIISYVVNKKGDGPHKEELIKNFGDRIVEFRTPRPSDNSNISKWPLCKISLFQKRFQWWGYRADILRTIAKIRPDIVIFNEWWHLELSLKLRHYCALIGIWHSNKLTDGYFESVAKYSDNLDAVVGVSLATSQNLKKYGGEKLHNKIHTIIYGLNSKDCHYPNRNFAANRPLKIAYVGRFEERQKRVSDIPKIMAALRSYGVSFEITLAGDGPNYAQTQQQFEACSLQAKFLGQLNYEAIMRLWEAHDVMLLTSSFEGGPLVVLEAISKGCVPVTSRCSGGLVHHVMEHGLNGFTFEVGDIKGAAEYLARLCKDRELLKRLSEAAFETSKRYTVEAMLFKYAELFHQVASVKKVPWSAWDYLTLWIC